MTYMTKKETGSPGTTLRQRNKEIYWAWKAIKQRCLNPVCKAYRNYGARGITVCEAWMKFEPFCEWALNNGYEKGLDIDRIDNEGDYKPSNCRWISRRENINNRRKTLFFTVDGVTKCRTEWENDLNLPRGALKGWSLQHGKAYVELRIKEIMKNGYQRNDYGYSHRKRIMHCESGIVFPSVRDAAKYFGFPNPCTIVNSIRRNGTTRKGRFRYEILDETEE